MRWSVLAAVAALVSGAVAASEPVAVSLPVAEIAAPVVVRDLAAVPPPVVASLVKAKNAPEIKPADRPRLVRKSTFKKSMLSRSARNQMALLAVKPRLETAVALNFFGDEDGETGIDDLDLHRSFARPKLVKVGDLDDDENLDVSEHVKLRLFLARMKAVEAHKAAQFAKEAQPQDEGLSDAVKLRLFLARTRALQAHQKKFT